MKKSIWLIVAGIVGVAIIGLLLLPENRQTDESGSSGAEQFSQQYPKVDPDHHFSPVTSEEAISIFEDGSGLVFLGFKDCPWCQELAPRVDRAAKKENLDKVYYLDIQQAREDNSDEYQKLVSILEKYLQKDEEGKPRIFVPDVSAVRKGEIVGRYKQESVGDEANTPSDFWTDERSERAVRQVRKLIQSIR